MAEAREEWNEELWEGRTGGDNNWTVAADPFDPCLLRMDLWLQVEKELGK